MISLTGIRPFNRIGDEKSGNLPELHEEQKDRKFNATCGSIFSPDRSYQSPILHGEASESAKNSPGPSDESGR
jgi:hypothetical protein